MDYPDKEKQLMESKSLYDKFCVFSAIFCIALWTGAWGYGTFSAIKTAIKNWRTASTNAKPRVEPHAAPFYEMAKKMSERAM